jgi:hypothetical protein
MRTFAARLLNSRNNGTLLVAFGLLVALSQWGVRTAAQSGFFLSLSGEQLVAALPVSLLCETLAGWLPIGGQVAVFCPWMGLLGTAARLLCGA